MSIEILATILITIIFSLFITGILFLIVSQLNSLQYSNKITELNNEIRDLHSMITSLITDEDLNNKLFRTADGKYIANSFEELIDKMANDPDGPLTNDEIDAIRSVLNKIIQEPIDDDDEPWADK